MNSLQADRFYTYEGSLTTPGCYESVTWIVLNSHPVITDDQVNVIFPSINPGIYLILPGFYLSKIAETIRAVLGLFYMSCRAVPCRVVPCRAVPCRAVPCRAVP